MNNYFNTIMKFAEIEDNAAEGAGIEFLGGAGTPATAQDGNSNMTEVTKASKQSSWTVEADIAGAIGNSEVGAIFSGADGGGATTLADQDSGLSTLDYQGTRETGTDYKDTTLNKGFFHRSQKTALQGVGWFSDQGADTKKNDPTALQSKGEVEADQAKNSPATPGGYASTLSMMGLDSSDPMGGMTHGSSIYFGLNDDYEDNGEIDEF